MTTKISLDNFSGAAKPEIHFIPCDTDTSGVANVEKYFKTYEKDESQHGVVTNALRGYPLVGNTFKIPKTHSGVILTTSKSDSSTMKVSGKFTEFTYWNYDTNPSKNDALKQAMDWMEISKVLHEDDEDCV
ncbi:uncharacterized protein DMENIID0001_048620 [Sergentomyia squamirostris]